MRYKKPSNNDFKAIAHLMMNELYLPNYIYKNIYGDSDFTEQLIKDLEEEHSHSEERFIVAKEFSKVVGFIHFCHAKTYVNKQLNVVCKLLSNKPAELISQIYSFVEDDSLYVSSLVVDKNFRSNNIGLNLLDHACSYAKDNKYSYLTLHVWEENQKGINFYLKHNFDVTNYIEVSHDSVSLPINKKIYLARRKV